MRRLVFVIKEKKNFTALFVAVTKNLKFRQIYEPEKYTFYHASCKMYKNHNFLIKRNISDGRQNVGNVLVGRL